jgi:hypothetical protein
MVMLPDTVSPGLGSTMKISGGLLAETELDTAKRAVTNRRYTITLTHNLGKNSDLLPTFFWFDIIPHQKI